MKRFITIVFLATFIADISYSQPSKITIFQNTNRSIVSFKKDRMNNSEKQIYIQFDLDYSTSDNYSGTILKYLKQSNSWSKPYNNFLSTICTVDPPGQFCAGINFFMVAPSDTNYVLNYRRSSWSSDPDARTFLTTNAGVSYIQYSNFQCGGAMFYPSGGDINSNNSVWFYSYPDLFASQIPKIYKSTDHGENWTAICQIANLRTTSPDNTFHPSGGFLKINPFDESHMFIVHKDYMMLSTNGGYNFNSINIPPMKEVVFDHSDSTIYTINDSKIYRSRDKGLFWDSSSVPFTFNTLEISPDNNNLMYAGSPAGVYRSTNRGSNWYLYNNSFTGTRNVIGISKDSNTGDTIIVCTNNEVYKVFRDELVDVNTGQENIKSFRLYQNFPNPFNPSTIIKFVIMKPGFTTLKVFDPLGVQISNLVNRNLQTGSYEINFDASSYPSGIYYYTLKTKEFVETRKMMLLK